MQCALYGWRCQGHSFSEAFPPRQTPHRARQSSSQLKRPPNGSGCGTRIDITFCTGGGLRGRRGSVH